MTSTAAATWTRVAPGFYRNTDGWEISHIEAEDEGNGYGRTDHWVAVDPSGYPLDPEPTYRDAKLAVAEATTD